MERRELSLATTNPPANASAGIGVDVANFASAYVAAVGASAFVYGVQYGIEAWMTGAASSVPMPYRLSQIIDVSIFGALFFAVLALWLALVPAGVSAVIAQWRGWGSLHYYLTCGILTAITLAPVVEWMFRHDDGTDFPPTFEELCLQRIVRLTAPAVLGSIAYWFVMGRLRDQSRNS